MTTIKHVSCGCCSNGCACRMHTRDIVRICDHHNTMVQAPLDSCYRLDPSVGDYVRVPVPTPTELVVAKHQREQIVRNSDVRPADDSPIGSPGMGTAGEQSTEPPEQFVTCPRCRGQASTNILTEEAYCHHCETWVSKATPWNRDELMTRVMQVVRARISAQGRNSQWRESVMTGFDSPDAFDAFADDVARNSAIAILDAVIGPES